MRDTSGFELTNGLDQATSQTHGTLVSAGQPTGAICAPLLLAGVPYVVTAFTSLAAPQFNFLSNWLSPLMAGELPMLIWLPVWGAQDQPRKHATPAPALA